VSELQSNFYIYAIFIRVLALFGGLFVLYIAYRLFEHTCFEKVTEAIDAKVSVEKGEVEFKNASGPVVLSILAVVIIMLPFVNNPSLDYTDVTGASLNLKSGEDPIDSMLKDAASKQGAGDPEEAMSEYLGVFKWLSKDEKAQYLETLLGLSDLMLTGSKPKPERAIAFLALASTIDPSNPRVKALEARITTMIKNAKESNQ